MRGVKSRHRTPRRPSLPKTICGLFEAISLSEKGDDRPLMRWDLECRPALVAALARVRCQPADAEDIVQDLLLVSLDAVRKAKHIRDEPAFLAGIAGNLLASRNRRAGGSSLDGREPTFVHDPAAGMLDSESRESVRRRIRETAYLLPPPYREICIRQYINGLSRRAVSSFLGAWARSAGRSIQPESARNLLRRAHRMFSTALAGADVRRTWPGTYAARRNPWILFPPPPETTTSE